MSLAFSGFSIYSNPTVLANPETATPILAGIATGVGLILAKDASVITSKMPTADEIAAGADVAEKLKAIIKARKERN